MESKMQYNECGTCGAKDGRAGMLIGKDGLPDECLNCSETRETGNIVVYAMLSRTDEELQRTFDILRDLISLGDV